jgi:hypothetical protein
MNKVFFVLFFLLFFKPKNVLSTSSSGICNEDGTSCVYPQGWDVCLMCTSNADCNNNPCVTASLLNKQSGCYGISNKACNCSADTANAPCAQGDGCCYHRLSYNELRILVGVVGWIAAPSFYLGRYTEAVLHVIVVVLGAVAIIVIYSFEVKAIDPEDTKDKPKRCSCCYYRPTCTPRFAAFWTVLSLWLLVFILWWMIDVILYTQSPIYDAYNLQLI